MAKRKPPGTRQTRRGERSAVPGGHSGNHAGGHRPPSARARPHGDKLQAWPTHGTVWLYGDHAVAAALANLHRRCLRLVGPDRRTVDALVADIPAERQPAIEILDRSEVDALLPPGAVHQGIALLAALLPDRSVADICEAAKETPNARVVILDQVTDPQNVGAVLRSAAAFGAMAVIMQDRHAPPATGALARAASGALERVALVRAVNLNRALGELKDAGFWTIGLDGSAPASLAATRPDGKTALVLGAEDRGLRRLTREACDTLARIPISSEVESLNVSNAAAIALYELTRGG